MIQYILWAISFISLWMALVWLNVLVLEPKPRKSTLKHLPKVTIALPAYNEESRIAKTIRSLTVLNYPLRLLDIIVVDDGSKDKTFSAAKKVQREYSNLNIKVLQHDKNKGKAAAVNTALANSSGELFVCLDAETHAHPDVLKHMIGHFDNKKLGAVIGQVKVDEPKNIWSVLQRVEYISSNFIRRLMSNFNTLGIAPGGAFSIFRTNVLKKVGGFDEAGLTEDLEIALRLRSKGYGVHMEPRAITYTHVPQTWNALTRQRVRWYRGFTVNHLKYRSLFFKKKQGLYGMFQLPVNVLGIALLLFSVMIISYNILHNLYELLYRSLTIKGYFFNHVLDFPSIKELLLSQNVHIILPIIVVAILGFYLIYMAHLKFSERLFRHLHHVVLFVLVSPYVTTVHWISALMLEAFRVRRKW